MNWGRGFNSVADIKARSQLEYSLLHWNKQWWARKAWDNLCSCCQEYTPASALASKTEACWSEMDRSVGWKVLHAFVWLYSQATRHCVKQWGRFCPLKLATSIENKTKGQKTASLFTSLCRSLPTAKQRYLHPSSSRRCAETQQMGSQDYPQGEQLCSSVHHVLCHLHHWEVSPVCCCPDSLWHFPDTQKLIDWHLHPVQSLVPA